tara:strand:- start:1290 stop:1448 length:159 start_codon:yes stop_codon:yes gene_type:complete
MEKEIYYKPVYTNKKIISSIEESYNRQKLIIINNILKELKNENILKIKDNSK